LAVILAFFRNASTGFGIPVFYGGKSPGGEISTITSDGGVAMPSVLDVLNGENRPPVKFLTNISQKLDRLTASTAFGFATSEIILTDMFLGGTDTLALPVSMMTPRPNV
jgi:hypothetical protein